MSNHDELNRRLAAREPPMSSCADCKRQMHPAQNARTIRTSPTTARVVCFACYEKFSISIHVDELRKKLTELGDDARVYAFERLQEGYCRHCGCNDPRCQCNNDE